MQVKLYAVDQESGIETLQAECDILDCFDGSDDDQCEECFDAMGKIETIGSAFVGGGAAPLYRIEAA